MAKHVVGFDIDGVITDESLPDGSNIWAYELESYFKGIKPVRRSYLFTDAYGISEALVEEFMEARAKDIFRRVRERDGVRAVLERLVKADFEIHLITARDLEYAEVTKEWLRRHRIPYHELWFETGKADLCQRLGIEFFVDDNWENCREIMAVNIPVVLMNMEHNQDLVVSAPRVSGWNEIWQWMVELFGLEEDVSA